MGVYGLWKLIEPSGKPVPLDTLENKVLAVDVSIWIHQAIKGFQDSRGGTVPNAHLLGIYHRVCKLLYYKIKPVFVFDGGVPALKKQTIVKRQQLKAKNLNQANSIQQKLISTLLKHSAVAKVLSERTRAELQQQAASEAFQSNEEKTKSNIYALPPSQLELASDEEEDEIRSSDETSPSKSWDLHTIDVKSAKFKALPAETRHEILTELKETRKQNSWGRLHELPTQSDEFAGFQMNRLLNRYSVQVSLEEVKKEMGGHSLSLQELESLLKDTGVICNNDVGKRIASDENQKILFIKNVQEALKIAKEIDERKENNSKEPADNLTDSTSRLTDELEKDLETALKLSLQDQPGSSKQVTVEDMSYFSSSPDDDEDDDLDESSAQESTSSLLSSAKNYMTEYSGLTPSEINNIIHAGSQQSKVSQRKIKKIIVSDLAEVKVDSILEIDEDLQVQKAIEESLKNINVSDEIVTKATDLIKTSVITEKQKSFEDSNSAVDKFKNTLEKATTNLNLNVEQTADNNFGVEMTTKSKDASVITEKHESFEGPNSAVNKVATIDKVTGILEESTEKATTVLYQNVAHVEEISDDDSNSSDFIEVENNTRKLIADTELQVIVDDKEALDEEDDLFKDIFNDDGNNVKTPQETKTGDDIKINRPTSEVLDNTMEVEQNIKSDKVDKVSVESELKTLLSYVQSNGETALSNSQLEDLKDKIAQEKNTLYSARVTKERMAENISDQMYKDAQELLQLFGVPYIVAPMEAEAQCAFLEQIGLTDGSITDDSDIWLFGGKTVYKNFFNQSKHVLEFRSDNIEHHFRLSREQLILLAMLVGSDYTTGIPGVGPVTALEILAAFPVSKNFKFSQISLSPQQILSGLISFRNWFINGRAAAPQRATLRSKLKNCTISEGFPNFHILSAYLQPEVDKSEERFKWAKPDDVALIDFAKSKFGWTNEKSEEILKPVLKRMMDNKVQKSVKDYFKTKHKLIDRTESEKKMSKRVKKAVDKLDGNASDSFSDEELLILKETKAKSKQKTNAIETDIRAQIDKASGSKLNKNKKPRTSTKIRFERSNEPAKPKIVRPNLHNIDRVHQKEMAQNDILQNKMRAIETFRKSKAGPGYVKKRKMVKRVLKDEAELSESSDSN